MKSGIKLVWVFDHQVYIQRHTLRLRQRLERRYEHCPNRQVGHEMPVHDVDVDIIRPGNQRFLYLLSQPGEI